MNFLEKFDIIELADNKKYTVAEIYKENDETLLMMLEMNGDEVSENLVYGKIAITKNKKYGVLEIKDEAEIERLNLLFKPLFEETTK